MFFYILGKCKMKLNLSKCVFAIRKERFLGFLVSSKGIKPILRRFKQY